MLSDNLVKEFQKIIKEEGGVELDVGQAKQASENLVKYFQLLQEIDQKSKTHNQNASKVVVGASKTANKP